MGPHKRGRGWKGKKAKKHIVKRKRGKKNRIGGNKKKGRPRRNKRKRRT